MPTDDFKPKRKLCVRGDNLLDTEYWRIRDADEPLALAEVKAAEFYSAKVCEQIFPLAENREGVVAGLRASLAEVRERAERAEAILVRVREGLNARVMRFSRAAGDGYSQGAEDSARASLALFEKLASVHIKIENETGTQGTVVPVSGTALDVCGHPQGCTCQLGELKPSEEDIAWREAHGLNPDGTSKTEKCEGVVYPGGDPLVRARRHGTGLFETCGKPAIYALRAHGPAGDLWQDKALCESCAAKYEHQGRLLHILDLRRSL